MPKRTDIKKILLIGSGPIVIGQGCEFDYSGTQACKALREEGYQVILINSNPATIMTDPETAYRTYIEHITPEFVEKIIEKERPDACLPTMGGQTALNTAIQLYEKGVFKKYGVELIGANYEAIKKAEDRSLFKKAMQKIGVDLPKSDFAYTTKEALAVAKKIGYPCIVRPSFTLGGSGSGVAWTPEELKEISGRGLQYSLTNEVLIEESLLGWKEFELEVMRDKKDNVVIVCSIENFDPMGVHTGDSITVAPAQTLTDKEYQRMRDEAIRIIREIGVDTGGSNIQFAIHPKTGRMIVIEMNPRVSRSSALASKATGFPIAKFAAKLAVGYTLDEIPNDITRETPASFEPVIDYCVIKIPRFTFEKFPGSDDKLGSQMKSVGEAMAIGRTFKEALQKGLRSLETKRFGWGADGKDVIAGEKIPDRKALIKKIRSLKMDKAARKQITEAIRVARDGRVFAVKYGFYCGFSVNDIYKISAIDPWFLAQMKQIVDMEAVLLKLSAKKKITQVDREVLWEAKRFGFSDIQLAFYFDTHEDEVRKVRTSLNIRPVYKLVDTCAAEFRAYTPYFYSTYETESELNPSQKKKVMILGGGPNRIGQGIEFDYCCVQAAFALKEMGYETLMVNSNPETVSTDYDTSDKLFFEPLTKEDVLNIYESENPLGVVVQLGGQTPLNLARGLEKAGVQILGTSADSIHRAEDREEFKKLLQKIGLRQPANGIAFNLEEAEKIALEIGYPVIVRPSYVLGGRAMEIVYDKDSLDIFMKVALEVSEKHPVLIDKFLEDATEVDVDLISDGKRQVIGAVMEHIEQAGIHSGDSASVIPTFSIPQALVQEIVQKTKLLGQELNVLGLMNVQYAIQNGVLYCLEVNPRGSRTVPFVSKAIGRPLAKYAARIMGGDSLEKISFTKEIAPEYYSVKESVFPFIKFRGVDITLSPEMKSTGEVMGIDKVFGIAFLKSQLAAGAKLKTKGKILVKASDMTKKGMVRVVRKLKDLGLDIIATARTAETLEKEGIKVGRAYKPWEDKNDILAQLEKNEISLIINTPLDSRFAGREKDYESSIRKYAVLREIPVVTTLSGALATAEGLEAMVKHTVTVTPLQDYHAAVDLIHV